MATAWSTPREGTLRNRPCAVLSWYIGRCSVVAWVMRDEAKVYIGGGEFGDAPPREAEVEEVEALAERFRSAELQHAAVRMRSPGPTGV